MRTVRLLASVVLVFLCTVAARSEGFVIEHFGCRIELRADASFLVEERIDVVFTEPRRGIFRVIPTRYDTTKGVERGIFLTQISATETNGDAITTQVKRSSGEVNIRMGDEDIVLPAGTQKTYVIRYKVENGLNWFNEGDWQPAVELYWNVTGNRWEVPIRAADLQVRFPGPVAEGGVRAKIFAGALGDDRGHVVSEIATRDDQVTATRINLAAESLRVQRYRPLAPYEGLTVVVNLPEKSIPKPDLLYGVRLFLLANLGFGIPLIVLAFMALAWMVFGRDAHPGPMVVQFDPPDDLSGPEAGAMLDEHVDPRDFASGIISLAVKGYLRLEPHEEGLVFKKRKATIEMVKTEPGPDLTIFEAKLLRFLRLGGEKVSDADLRQYVAPHSGELRQALYSALVHRGYYSASPEIVRGLWATLGIIASGGLAFLFAILSPTGAVVPSIIGGGVGAIIAWWVSKGMPKRTHVGGKALAKVRGFEEFIRRAKKHELGWMAQKHPDQAMFEKYLPHAIAFGLTREWADAFESIVTEMPSWYRAPAGTPFDSRYFGSDMVSISRSFGTSAMTIPRAEGGGASGGSSGFSSGGGFSGGGFGGGGGGSW